MKNKNIIRILVIVGLILLIPLIAMQFTNEVNWDLADFIIMGILLFGTGLALEFTAKKFTKPIHRILVKMFIVMIFILIWAELAVGVFGTPWAGS